MAEYIKKGNGRVKVKFHAKVKQFKRVEKFKHNGQFFNIYVNKNDSVYNLERTKILSWKEVVKGKKKIRIPDAIEATPDPVLLNKVRGNSYKTAVHRIITELEKASFE
jgi:hypothetical protein